MAVDRTTDRATSNARPLGEAAAHEAELWAELASNAIVLAEATEDRCRLLVARARLWDQLADLSTPACGRAYRDAAFKCRAEAAGHRARAEPAPPG
jgi:hypothetical protein